MLYGVVYAGPLYTSKSLDPKTGQNAGHGISMITGDMPSLFCMNGTEDSAVT